MAAGVRARSFAALAGLEGQDLNTLADMLGDWNSLLDAAQSTSTA